MEGQPIRKLLATSAAILTGFAMTASADIQDRQSFKVLGAVVVWGADQAGNSPVVSDFILDTGNGTSSATSGDTDLIDGDVHTVVTGSLVATDDSYATGGVEQGMPFLITNTTSGTVDSDSNNDGVVSADDSFSPFGIQINSDTAVDATVTRSSFYVASNTPFAIDAQVFPNAGTTLALLNVTRMELTSVLSGDDGIPFGGAAQYAHTGGANGGFAPSRRLRNMLTNRRVFTGNQRTAASPGTLTEQSIRFDAEYSISAAALRGYDLSLGTFDFEVDVVYTVFVP